MNDVWIVGEAACCGVLCRKAQAATIAAQSRRVEIALVRNVPQEPSGHQGRVGSVDDSAAAIAWRLSRPGCPIFSLPLDADAFGVEKTGFARKLAARPQGAGGGCAMGRGLRILGFWFGRAGVAAGGWGCICCAAVYAAPWARWALPRPAKEPQVPWILHLLPRFWSVALRKIAGSSGDHRRAEPSGRSNVGS